MSQRWTRRPAEVEAICLTAENVHEVTAFAGGRADRDDMGDPIVHLPKTTIPVTVGDYAVRDVLPDGLSEARCMKEHLFCWAYARVAAAPLRHRRKDADESR